MVTVFRTVTSPGIRCGATTTSQNQNDSLWNGDMEIFHEKEEEEAATTIGK